MLNITTIINIITRKDERKKRNVPIFLQVIV